MIEQGNTNAYLQNLRILSIALITGMILFAGVVFALNAFDVVLITEFQDYFEIVIAGSAGFAFIFFLIARHLFGKKMQEIKTTSVNIYDKLNQYRAAFVSYMALCEAHGLFAIVLFLLSGIYWLLLVTIAMILAMAARFPTKQKLINDMDLDWAEQQELE
jgi:hypothetical protein